MIHPQRKASECGFRRLFLKANTQCGISHHDLRAYMQQGAQAVYLRYGSFDNPVNPLAMKLLASAGNGTIESEADAFEICVGAQARVRETMAPTFAEMGLPTLTYSSWYGLAAPKGTPGEIIGKLNAAAVEALADPVVRSRLAELGCEIFPRERQTPEALAAMQSRC
jgi:hypothetical protein